MVKRDTSQSEEACAYVRELYCEAVRGFNWARGTPRGCGEFKMPKWDGGEDAYGVKHQPIWPKLVEFYLEQSLDPAAVIEAIFHIAVSQGFTRSPKPSDLFGPKAMAAFNMVKQRLIDQQTATLAADQERLRTWTWHFRTYYNFDEDKARHTALMSGRSELSPLFRYIMSLKHNYEDVCQEYKRPALYTYIWNKVLLEGWRKVIPPELDKEAQEFRDALRGK
jgi:hypothetical protein